MHRAALDAAYNNSAAVKNSTQIVAEWQVRSEAVRRRFEKSLDIRYGADERNRIDLFEANPGAPLLVFIHGGYWQMRAKENFAFVAEGPLAHGISVAMVGYTLAPQKHLDSIVREIRTALDFLDREVILSGWSAGGHLTAMNMPHPRVMAGVAISGIYNLEPIRHSYINEKLRLDESETHRNSPVMNYLSEKPIMLAYGTAELPELQRQSQEYAVVRKRSELRPLEGHDHFTILEELASPTGALTAMVRAFLGAH